MKLKFLCLLIFVFIPVIAAAQTIASTQETGNVTSTANSPPRDSEIEEVKRQLDEQKKEIEQLREMLLQQAQIIQKLQNNPAQTAQFRRL